MATVGSMCCRASRMAWSAASSMTGLAAALAAASLSGCQCSSGESYSRSMDAASDALCVGNNCVPAQTDGAADVEIRESGSRDSGEDVTRNDSGRHLDSAVADGSPGDVVPRPDSAAPPVSLYCGDGIRGPTEECDDGNSVETDLCTSFCTTLDMTALAPEAPTVASYRDIARGGHVAAAGADGGAVLFVDQAISPYTLGLSILSKSGVRLRDAGITVSDTKTIALDGDSSVAALPGNRYAVAWSAYSSSTGWDVYLRTVDGATAALGSPALVNTSTAGGQANVDMVWTGTELVVAWTDSASVLNPHVKYRRYDSNLQPKSGEALVSTGHLHEALPALAAFGNSWACAWFDQDSLGNITYFARAGTTEWQVGGFVQGAGDLPRLTALDTTHWLLVVSENVWVADAGNPVPRLFGAVLDTAAPGATSAFPIDAVSPHFNSLSEMDHPVLATVGSSAYLSFWEGPGLTFLNDRQLALKELPWRSTGLDLSVPEIPLPRDPTHDTGQQNYPALAAAPWTWDGTLLAAWLDTGQTFGTTERANDVVVEAIPLPLLRLSPADGGTIGDQ